MSGMASRTVRQRLKAMYLLIVIVLAIAVYAVTPADVRQAIYDTYLKEGLARLVGKKPDPQ